MRNYAILVAISPLATTHLLAQVGSPTGTIWRPNPRHYAVKQAREVESPVPMDRSIGMSDPVQFIPRVGCLKTYPDPVSLRWSVDWFVRA